MISTARTVRQCNSTLRKISLHQPRAALIRGWRATAIQGTRESPAAIDPMGKGCQQTRSDAVFKTLVQPSVTGALFLLSASAASAADPVAALADLDAATAHTLEGILRPLFTIFTMLYIVRIPMTWYPSIDGTQLPWLLAYAPTEPILKVTRKVSHSS